ncbi:MAG: YkvA family protein [Anaerolineales bacterium]
MSDDNQTQDKRSTLQKMFDRLTLSWRLLADRRVDLPYKIIPPLALLYLLSPIDIVPDVFLPFGIVDDVGVVIFALEFFIRMAPNDVVREHLKDLQERVIRDQDDKPRGSDDVIEGEYEVRD